MLGRSFAWFALLGLGVSVVAAACGSDNKVRHLLAEQGGAGAGGEAGTLGGGVPAGGVPAGGAPVTATPGAGGEGGVPAVGGAGGTAEAMGGAPEVGGQAGAAGAPSCAESCPDGACVFGECLPAITISTGTILTTTPVTPGRQCAEAPQWSVKSFGATSVTVTAPIVGDCLAVGDEVMLINLQGAPLATANVGNWELLRVASVQADTVQLTAAKQRFYGATAGSDAGLGIDAGTERVALIRVPRFGKLTIADGGIVTALPWNGTTGGVVAFRAGQLIVDGAIDATTLGYRGGRWSNDDITCSDSIQTEAGESIGGPGNASNTHNDGASGGIAAGSSSFNNDDLLAATPGHAAAGQAGINPNGRAIGGPGSAYGTSDGSKLTLGSASGGALACDAATHLPLLVDKSVRAAGIIAVFSDVITLGATSSISATPPQSQRVANAGGFVLLRGSTFTLGTGKVTAQGSIDKAVNGKVIGQQNQAGAGYVVLDAPSISGTTNPVAKLLQ